MSDIRSFKLVTGDEIIASVVREIKSSSMLTESEGSSKVEGYVVKRPHSIQFQPVAPGQLGLALIPFTLSNPDIAELTIPASALVIPPFATAHGVQKQYLEQTSGIDLGGLKAK